MKLYDDDSIELQKWILMTIGVGLVEVFFRVGDYWIWNEDGKRAWYALYVGLLLGVCKRGVSRVLVIMVSLGWGVVRDTLGDTKRMIIIVGTIYMVLSAIREISDTVMLKELERAHKDPPIKLFDFVKCVTLLVVLVDTFIYLWIFDSLSGTIHFLENMNQNMKLKRYLRFRLVLSFSVLFAFVWGVFGLVDQFMPTGILNYEQKWAESGAWEVNYLIILISVAILWRPHPDAKNYAYVMELSSDVNDIEMETSIEMVEDDSTTECSITVSDQDPKNGHDTEKPE